MGVSIEINMEPVAVAGIFPVLQNVLECEKASARMVEYAVQHDADTSFVHSVADFFEIIVIAQTHVNLTVIPGIIAVGVRFKQWREIDGIYA